MIIPLRTLPGTLRFAKITHTTSKMYKLLLITLITAAFGCSNPATTSQAEPKAEPVANRIPILIDTDANNELDDQHALAYAFFNRDVFDIKGITVNATRGGGDVDEQYAEAQRVFQLCDVWNEFPLKKGANGKFEEIRSQLDSGEYDGHEAVDFIIKEALKMEGEKLVLIPIGKLTNIALAIEKAPQIREKVRIVWLGANYPEPGEYNLENDTSSMTYVLEQDVPFEMVTVRYGAISGSDAVRVTPDEIKSQLQGKGPQVDPVTGRHGGTFTSFGDYSVNLFSNIKLHGDPPARALFDLVAVAVVKNAGWGKQRMIPAPKMLEGKWYEKPENDRQIIIWENFDKASILSDFFDRVKNAGS